MDWRDRIDSDPDVIGGKLRIKGTRIGVALLLRFFAAGWTEKQVLESYPHLTPDDLKAVFAFSAEAADDTFLISRNRPAAA